jgi:spermidine synthase
MIDLYRGKSARGEVAVTLEGATRIVRYRKAGVVQSAIDARGRNLSPFVTKAAKLLTQGGVRRVLVLGHGGGLASRLLHKQGLEVVAVDCDPCAEGLGRLFFRAPPKLAVVVADAGDYLDAAPPASFDAVLVDIQDAAVTPADYLARAFWERIVIVLRPPAVVVVRVTSVLHLGPDWRGVQKALAAAGLDSVALSEPFTDGDRLLLSLGPL